MLATSARLLQLLGLLQAGRDWNGSELAKELGVTTRTVRKDVERLRDLGYPVDSAAGPAGGYRLGAGASLPPLLLSDEEAVAIAVGLRTAAAGGAVTGIEESAVRALRKLEQVLPHRLQRRIAAIHDATLTLGPSAAPVTATVLSTVAAAIRDREQIRFDYEDWEGRAGCRSVEPHRLVHNRGRWYLVGWDCDRDDWRTFRADRISLRTHTGPRFTPRPEPEGDLAAYVQRGLDTAMWRRRARVKVHASAVEVAARVPAAVTVEAIDDRSCFAHTGANTPAELAQWLAHLDADFEVAGDDPELVEELRMLARRLQRAV